MFRSKRYQMVAYAITGSALWGLSGTVSSILFSRYGMPFSTLVTIRMVFSGLILLAAGRGFVGKKDLPMFLVFAIPGLFGVQILYLATISFSNAPVATLLQFLFFPMVAVYDYITIRSLTVSSLILALIFSVAGIYELTTGFPLGGTALRISLTALILGLATAATAALYTVTSARIVKEYGGLRTVASGMMVGGLVSLPLGSFSGVPYFHGLGQADVIPVLALTIFVIVFGTSMAFYLYINSMRYISPVEAAVSGTFEPVAAAMSSYLLLGIKLSAMQYLGGALIVISILVIVISKNRRG
ncbi:conserved hypothetical membrane protein [Thermoplasma acidophilum]|uniref:Conserved hypothetical membrane protein n=2 Tax=Thermoplasma acidophilum TaxID=2303 RepID=Q9HI75_THEAC|nr:conserved hypothetical membrane protein [Thermoplasma acidophilum]